MNTSWTRRRGSGAPADSEFDDLMLDSQLKQRAEPGADVHPTAKESGQLTLEGDEVQQCGPRLEVHEEVEVARIVRRIAGD